MSVTAPRLSAKLPNWVWSISDPTALPGSNAPFAPVPLILHELRGRLPGGWFGGLQALQDLFFPVLFGGFAAEQDRKLEIRER
jgi:hypothetical protein